MSQLDLFPAKKARDRALKQVSENAGTWINEALALIPRLHGEKTGEDIRNALMILGLHAPHHHNTWGALTSIAIKQGLLIPTGRFTHMTGPKSHARMTQIYRVA